MPAPTVTNRWRGVVAVTLAAASAGLLARRPALLLVGVIGIVFAAYTRVAEVPALDLELDRRVGTIERVSGETVTVDVTLRNDGPDRLWDVRMVDGVPPALAVVGGTPRHGTTLGPGATTTFTYEIEAQYGRHRFEPATVVVRDASGARECRTTVADETELACLTVGATAVPPRSTNRYAGQVASGAGGTGIEFSRTKTYRPGDPVTRIDWNRYARRRELTTVLYREQRAQTVVALVDARAPAYRGLDGGPDAITAVVGATEQLATAYVENRDRVGVAALGWPGVWLAPGTGRDHLLTARNVLTAHRAFDTRPPERELDPADQLEELRARLSDDAQVALLTPLCDDVVADVARRLEAAGHPVTVFTPDVTSRDTPGRRLAAIERDARIDDLRRAEVPVIDWSPTVPFDRALATAGVP